MMSQSFKQLKLIIYVMVAIVVVMHFLILAQIVKTSLPGTDRHQWNIHKIQHWQSEMITIFSGAMINTTFAFCNDLVQLSTLVL